MGVSTIIQEGAQSAPHQGNVARPEGIGEQGTPKVKRMSLSQEVGF